MRNLTTLLLTCLLMVTATANNQYSNERFQQADSVRTFGELVYHSVSSVNWIENSSLFWYKVKTRKGLEYKLVDAEKTKISPLFDQEKFIKVLNKETEGQYEAYQLDLRKLKYLEKENAISFELKNKSWKYDLGKNNIEILEEVSRENNNRYWGRSSDEDDSQKKESPDGKLAVYVKEYNVFLLDKESGDEVQLSFDGSPGDYYSSRGSWSPDSKKYATHKIRKHEKRYIHFIESSPSQQLQPVLQKREYAKPGDALPIRRPCLFDAVSKKQITVETQPFEHQYSVSGPKWWPDSHAFTFEFNQRGHQVYQVVEVDAKTGDIQVLIDEKSNTFIDYSGKRIRHDLDDSNEIIWASERDGWNHLYLIDAATGKVKNQVTKGAWVVRDIVSVRENEREIIFRGSGMNAGEDPYFIHYYKINFDGSGLVDLTPEPANHKAAFSSDFRYYTDIYSTVDQPPVSVLRSMNDTEVLRKLESADIADLLARNWKAPEVFAAKGRDGKSDIWGNIYFPTHFDPEKKYPVIEYIYAGPHGSFVQKDFRAYNHSFSALAELGFIIVQIDGMGTSNRSKEFHDICYKNLKDAGFPDRIIWMKAAAETRPYMDLSRVGIFGTSAGAQSAMGALLFHPEFYKAGVSSCGCHDNRMDKMWWNEQWMGYPIGKHYEESSNVVNAHKLEGELMLIVGEIDDNVDPATTMQVADALIKANKDFELVVIPGARHTSGGTYGEMKRRKFFVRSLLNEQIPGGNQSTE